METIWISPIYKSPMVDFGYDISDFKDVDPIFGTLEDFKSMTDTAHELGIKIVMDFVPNHSSDQHEWFLKSVKREEPYTDYYVWKNASGVDQNGVPIPPNNWVSPRVSTNGQSALMMHRLPHFRSVCLDFLPGSLTRKEANFITMLSRQSSLT